jgi:hypothetical protein
VENSTNKTYFTESITKTTSSIVTLVSAMFVDKMIYKRRCQPFVKLTKDRTGHLQYTGQRWADRVIVIAVSPS